MSRQGGGGRRGEVADGGVQRSGVHGQVRGRKAAVAASDRMPCVVAERPSRFQWKITMWVRRARRPRSRRPSAAARPSWLPALCHADSHGAANAAGPPGANGAWWSWARRSHHQGHGRNPHRRAHPPERNVPSQRLLPYLRLRRPSNKQTSRAEMSRASGTRRSHGQIGRPSLFRADATPSGVSIAGTIRTAARLPSGITLESGHAIRFRPSRRLWSRDHLSCRPRAAAQEIGRRTALGPRLR